MLDTMRHLGIDYGTKYIGLAISDEDGKMGFPHAVIPNNEEVVDTLLSLIQKEEVGVVVMGESRHNDGSANKIFEASKDLAQKISEHAGVSVEFEPEFYTTKQARDAQELAGKTAERADAIAAAIILSSYLEKHGNHR